MFNDVDPVTSQHFLSIFVMIPNHRCTQKEKIWYHRTKHRFLEQRWGSSFPPFGSFEAHFFSMSQASKHLFTGTKVWIRCTWNPFLDDRNRLDCSPTNLNGLRKSLSNFKLLSNWWFRERGIRPGDFSKPQTGICLNKVRMLPPFENYQKHYIPHENFTFLSQTSFGQANLLGFILLNNKPRSFCSLPTVSDNAIL